MIETTLKYGCRFQKLHSAQIYGKINDILNINTWLFMAN
jgi:hypothetical protein